MALHKIEDFFPDYQQQFDGKDIKKYAVYAGTSEARIGFVRDVLVDESGQFRYFVVETGFWIFGKKVLLPIGRALIDSDKDCIYALGIKGIKQAEALPEYHDDIIVDYDYEESVRTQYRADKTITHSEDTYSYDAEPELFQLNERYSGETIKLYQERLIANKQRTKAGEVSISKKVETDTATVSVPVEKERVIIERHDTNSQPVAPESVEFGTEIAKVEVYEEQAKVEKQAVLREEVNIRKEVETETVKASETLRKEELIVDADGDVIERE